MKQIFMLTILLVTLAACSPRVEQIPVIETRTVEVQRPAPMVPEADQLRLRTFDWVIITPDNVDERFDELENGEAVFFALTAEGYENLALNLSDIRTLLSQQQQIISVYRSQFR